MRDARSYTWTWEAWNFSSQQGFTKLIAPFKMFLFWRGHIGFSWDIWNHWQPWYAQCIVCLVSFVCFRWHGRCVLRSDVKIKNRNLWRKPKNAIEMHVFAFLFPRVCSCAPVVLVNDIGKMMFVMCVFCEAFAAWKCLEPRLLTLWQLSWEICGNMIKNHWMPRDTRADKANSPKHVHRLAWSPERSSSLNGALSQDFPANSQHVKLFQ